MARQRPSRRRRCSPPTACVWSGLPLDALTDDGVDAEALFSPPFRQMVDRLAQHRAPDQPMAHAEAWLMPLVRAA